MVRPYNFTQTLTPQEKRFDKLLSLARVTVERALGVLKARWHCWLTLLDTNLENVSDVIITCFALHSFCQINNELYQDDETLEYLVQEERSWRVQMSTSSNEAVQISWKDKKLYVFLIKNLIFKDSYLVKKQIEDWGFIPKLNALPKLTGPKKLLKIAIKIYYTSKLTTKNTTF